MKKSIIYLGIALVTFTNVALALDFQQSQEQENLNPTQTTFATENLESDTNNVGKVNRSEGGNQKEVNPETITFPTYQKTIEEVIAENNLIIESDLSLEQTTEESIAEENLLAILTEVNTQNSEEVMAERIFQDSQIIESPVLNATKKETK